MMPVKISFVVRRAMERDRAARPFATSRGENSVDVGRDVTI